MSQTWLEKLENHLEAKLSQFLHANPYQESLLDEQCNKELYQTLKNQQKQLQLEADKLREKLILLAKEVRAWNKRSIRAKEAGASLLAKRAEKHLTKLMEQGRHLWLALDQLGNKFKENERQIIAISKESSASSNKSEEKWTKFEAQEELDQLRKKCGLNQ